MARVDFKYIYGPVSSWRLGSSLGIDAISGKEKICTFDCVYCQLGKTGILSGRRQVFVPTEKIIRELCCLPCLKFDYITFSGSGEPALAKNLGQLIKAIRKIRKEKIAVLTNASLIGRKDVREDLSLADFVAVKLDAGSQELLEAINKPVKSVKFNRLLKAINRFKAGFKGRLALQIMFIKKNKKYAEEIARIARQVHPDEIQINTCLRPCRAKPLSKDELRAVKDCFVRTCAKNTRIVTVYESAKKEVKALNREATLKRRGKALNGFAR